MPWVCFIRGRIGANALALPGGTILIADQLVGLAEHDSEIIGILVHEAGHVEGRHAMRGLLQTSVSVLIIVVLTGDLAELSELALALPTALLQAGYSRGFEREADIYTAQILAQLDESPNGLGLMLEKLQKACGDKCKDLGWFSTHPLTQERINTLKSGLE